MKSVVKRSNERNPRKEMGKFSVEVNSRKVWEDNYHLDWMDGDVVIMWDFNDEGMCKEDINEWYYEWYLKEFDWVVDGMSENGYVMVEETDGDGEGLYYGLMHFTRYENMR